MSVSKSEPGNFAARFTLAKGILDELADILLGDLVMLETMLDAGEVEDAKSYIRVMKDSVERELGDVEE